MIKLSDSCCGPMISQLVWKRYETKRGEVNIVIGLGNY